jgi:arylsulfatase A-like enzyme
VCFEWAFTQAPDTAPAQASILSGLYPSTHGLIDEQHRLADEVVTLAEALGEHGYTTAAFVDGGFMSADFGLAQGFETWDSSAGGGFAEIGPKVVTWLGEHAEENFLLLIHSYDAHPPYDPPEPYRSTSLAGVGEPSEGFDASPEQLEAARAAMAGDDPQPLPDTDLAYARALYEGEVRFVDEWVGRIVAELDRLGLGERATVVLISDHGQAFGEHGRLLHDGLYTPVTRVPFLLRLPASFAAQTVTTIVEALDLMPTLLDLAGAPPRPVQGESLVPLIRGAGMPPYLAFTESGDHLRAVALAGYHMILDREADRSELYRFTDDPLETTDLAAGEGERIEVLRRHVETWEEKVRAAAVGAEQGSVAEDTLEQLKSLGYIQ